MARPFEFANSYYQELLRVLGAAASTLPFAVLGLGLLARFNVLDGRFYAGDLYFTFIAIGFTLAALANFYFVFVRGNPSMMVYLVLTIFFHGMSVAFLLFVSGVNSPFLVGWIALVVAVDIYFGTISTLLSLMTLSLTAVVSIFLYPFLTGYEIASMGVAIFFVCAAAIMLSMLRAITDRERQALSRTRDQSDFQREQLLALVNSMGDAVVATDETGAIKVYNSTLLNLLDTNLDLMGKQLDNVLKLRDGGGHKIKLIEEAKRKRTVFSRTDLSYKFADSDELKLYVNVAPVQPSFRSHAESGYIFILRDITKEKSLEEERDEFISVVSHELRTPVAIAEGAISNIILLQQRSANQDMLQQTAKSAYDQIMYLSKLINDLSALSRAERGLGAEVEVVDPNEILHSLFSGYNDQANAKGLTLNLDLPVQLPHVVSSRMYLQEILQNLIVNAIKYTKQGSITIKGHEEPKGVVFDVSDTGIGISKADQKHIFEKFYRSEDYRTRESSGTGLGLYVCQKLAEKIGLKLTFESRLNYGSTFTVTVPPSQIAKPEDLTAAKLPADQAGLAEVGAPDSKHSAPSN